MNVISYALFAYALTALISFAVIGLIVFVNYMMSKKENENAINKTEEVEV